MANFKPELITLENNNGISLLTLNRPDQRNTMNETMRQDCITALTEFNADAKQQA